MPKCPECEEPIDILNLFSQAEKRFDFTSRAMADPCLFSLNHLIMIQPMMTMNVPSATPFFSIKKMMPLGSLRGDR